MLEPFLQTKFLLQNIHTRYVGNKFLLRTYFPTKYMVPINSGFGIVDTEENSTCIGTKVPIVRSDYQYKAINVKNQVRHMKTTIEDSQGKMSFMNLFYIVLVMATFASY